MSSKKARKARRDESQHAESIAQHARDMAYFAANPQIKWRVRRLVPGEMPDAEPEITHIITFCDLERNRWGSTVMGLIADDGSEPPDDAIYHYATMLLARELEAPYEVIYAMGGRRLEA